MQMDGATVNVGDRVYDTAYGPGVVEQLLVDSRFVVMFSTVSRRQTYSTSGTGVRFPTRTLFWHDPIIAVPAKDDTGWLKIQQICRAVVETLRVL